MLQFSDLCESTTLAAGLESEDYWDFIARLRALYHRVTERHGGTLAQISGDGMEHRNSTFISQPRSLKEADFAQIDTLSHEFTHSWNVERLRPRELEPFDFTRANPTPSLWFAEGFTQYIGPLMVRRA